MKHETKWKPGTVRAAKEAGRDLETTGGWPCRNRPHPKDHPSKCVPLAETLPTRRHSSPCSTPPTRTSTKAEDSAKTSFSGVSAKRGPGFWFCHRPMDLPTYRSTDPAALRRALSRRCDPTSDGFAFVLPLRSRNARQPSVTRQPSSVGWSMTGRGLSVEPKEGMLTWFSLTKRDFCCNHWFGGHGQFAARRRFFGRGLGTTGVFLQSADCLSRHSVTVWDGTCNSLWTARSGRNRLLPFCVIFCGILLARSLSFGIIWLLTKVGHCVSGCVDAGGFIWNTCLGMLQSLIPTSTDGGYLKTNPLANYCPSDIKQLYEKVVAAGQAAASQRSLLRSFIYAIGLSIRFRH